MKVRGLALIPILLAGMPALAQQKPASATPSQDKAPAAATPGQNPAPDLTPDAEGKLSPEQMRELTRVVMRNFLDNGERQRDYTYIERDVDKAEDGGGNTKSTEIKTYDVTIIYGERVWRMIEKDDKPLDAKEAAKEEEKIQKIIDKHKAESDDDRKKEEEKRAKQGEEFRKFVSAVADSHDFKLAGTELVDGREAWVIDGEPRPEFELKDKEQRFAAKFRGRLWIDKECMQMTKVDLEAIDTASVGWVLMRIHKGTRVTYERIKMDDEVWLPRHMTFKLDARVALLKGYKIDADRQYRDYKKFRTSSRIVGIGEVKP
jgi:hypothetical protein